MSRVTDIRHVAYGVVDFEAERNFYAQTWGLAEVVGEGDRMAWFRAHGQEEPWVVRLRRSDANHLDMIGFAAASREDVDALHARVVQADSRIIHAPRTLGAPGGGYGFRFFSPDGLPFEISSDVAPATRRAVDRWEGVPERISHVVLHSPKRQELVQYFTDVLGFRVSDWLGDFMCFLRCNEAHHRVAILPGPACLNHVAYDVPGVDAMMRGISRLKQLGVDLRWGPGRHLAGNNTFSYFVTPAGFAVEYTADLELVDFEKHVDRVHAPGPHVMDQWGIAVGGPHTMPHPAPDPRLFQATEV